jgi:CheY-like chemotaxis protein
MSAPRVLVVEDERVTRSLLGRELKTQGYDVIAVGTASEAIHAANERKPDLLILDLTLNSDPLEAMREGFMLLGWLRRMLLDPVFPVIIHTGNTSPELDARAQAENIYAVVRKDGEPGKLLELVGQALADSSGAIQS